MYVAVFVMLGGLAAFVQPWAWAAAPRCNVDVKGWPDCIPRHQDFVDALQAQEDSTFFWSGRVGGEGGWSVIDRAGEIAQLYGGNTLEGSLAAAEVGMPEFTDVDARGNRVAEYYEDDDQYLVNSAWTDASHVLANQARGLVYVVLGDWQRSNNVFNGVGDPEAGVELRALQANPHVWGIVKIDPVTLEESPYWHRDGYSFDQIMQRSAFRQAARACPVVQNRGFPTAPMSSTSVMTTAAPTPSPPRYHPTTIGRHLFPTGSAYWPLTTDTSSGRATHIWSTVPSPTPLETPSSRQAWALVHNSFEAYAYRNGEPSAYDVTGHWELGHRRTHSYVYPRKINCAPPAKSFTKRNLRVMPLGDSITYGTESSDGNGYREQLHEELAAGGNTVDFVGTQSAGTMSDKQNEGHPGWRIDQVATAAKCSVPKFRPNIITVHVGTNDANQDYQITSAGSRVKALIDQALKDSPDATVVVSQIIPTGKAGLQPRIDRMNNDITDVIAAEVAAGRHVVGAPQFDLLLSDGVQNDAHPTDAGYDKMGANFYDAIADANDQGWITDAGLVKVEAGSCGGTADDGTTALGAGWRKLGVIAPGMSRTAFYDRTELADMNGDGRSDYVQIRKDGSIRVGINTEGEPGKPTWPNWLGGSGSFLPSGSREDVPSEPGAPSVADQMRLADIDGDGRDDVVFVTDKGVMDVYLNISLTADGPPGWTKIKDFGPFTSTVNRNNIRFADVNGDGRDDVLRVGSDGEVHAYFNKDDGDASTHGAKPVWTEKLSWAPGVKAARLDNLRFADVDGDKKADYLMVGADGSVHAYLNKGGKDAGGFQEHKLWANASNYPGDLVQFKDISGDGKADYLVVYAEGAVRAWLNRGGNL